MESKEVELRVNMGRVAVSTKEGTPEQGGVLVSAGAKNTSHSGADPGKCHVL